MPSHKSIYKVWTFNFILNIYIQTSWWSGRTEKCCLLIVHEYVVVLDGDLPDYLFTQ
jgi:hypothetical protein